MYEFEIYNSKTNTTDYIFGYNLADAFRRNPSKNNGEWAYICATYID